MIYFKPQIVFRHEICKIRLFNVHFLLLLHFLGWMFEQSRWHARIIRDDLQWCRIVTTFFPPGDYCLLLSHYSIHDRYFILLFDRLFKIIRNLNMFIDEISPCVSSNEKALARCNCLVKEEGTLVESHSICSDDVAIFVSQDKVLDAIHFEADLVGSLVDKNYLVNFV